MKWADGKIRCCWANPRNERYIRYHDEEWGIPVHDDRKLFEMLILECFQAGLSWECVLNKRDAFRKAFDNFDPEKVSAYTEDKLEALRSNPGIIRNRLKIQAAVTNAWAFLEIQKEYGSFSDYIWHWTDGKVVCETGRTSSELSDRISKDLKKRGMKFVGTTVIYAYLQAPHSPTSQPFFTEVSPSRLRSISSSDSLTSTYSSTSLPFTVHRTSCICFFICGHLLQVLRYVSMPVPQFLRQSEDEMPWMLSRNLSD